MRSMGALEAANAIRNVMVMDRSSRASPEDQHQLRFLKEVAAHLGLEPDAENLLHLRAVLREHGITLHEGNEYPKWVVRKYDGTAHIADNEQEADAIINAEPPPPAEPAPRVVERPVQDLTIDLKDKVPHMVKSDAEKRREELARQQIDGDGTRQPSDITRQVAQPVGSGHAEPDVVADDVVDTDEDFVEADSTHDMGTAEEDHHE